MHLNMLARVNDHGVSVNESAVCEDCLHDNDAIEASHLNWKDAEDVSTDNVDDHFYPIDNEDGICNGCFRDSYGKVNHFA